MAIRRQKSVTKLLTIVPVSTSPGGDLIAMGHASSRRNNSPPSGEYSGVAGYKTSRAGYSRISHKDHFRLPIQANGSTYALNRSAAACAKDRQGLCVPSIGEGGTRVEYPPREKTGVIQT